MLTISLIKFFVIALITVEVIAKRWDPLKKKRILTRRDDNYEGYARPERYPPGGGYYPGGGYPGGGYPEHEPNYYPPWEPVTFPPTYPPQTRTTTQRTLYPTYPTYPSYPTYPTYPTFPTFTYPTFTTPPGGTTNMTTPAPTPPPGQCPCCNCRCDCLDGVLIYSTNQTLPPQCPICFGKRSLDDDEWTPEERVKRQTLFIDCFTAIRAASLLDTGSLLGLLVGTLLGNLVVPILMTILVGDNTLQNAVLPLANILCYIVGLLLLVLRSLGLLGLLGMGGLLQNILGGGALSGLTGGVSLVGSVGSLGSLG